MAREVQIDIVRVIKSLWRIAALGLLSVCAQRFVRCVLRVRGEVSACGESQVPGLPGNPDRRPPSPPTQGPGTPRRLLTAHHRINPVRGAAVPKPSCCSADCYRILGLSAGCCGACPTWTSGGFDSVLVVTGVGRGLPFHADPGHSAVVTRGTRGGFGPAMGVATSDG